MQIEQAVQVVTALREGVHPVTGEPLSANETCQQPEVIRALFVLAPVLERACRPRASQPANAGKPWAVADDERLTKAFGSGTPERELAASLGRSVTAIRMRVDALGLSRDDPASPSSAT